MSRIAVVLVALACVTLFICSCAPSRQSAPASAQREEPPAYSEVAARFNERADRLSRIWANATARFSYIDEKGKRRTEQGEGHFQYIAPDHFALSIGKVGNLLFWLGCDNERFWFFEMHESDRASIGRHANIGKPGMQDLQLPAHPLDIIDLLGITPLDPSADGSTSWSTNGEWLVVDSPGQVAWRRIFLDPATFMPARIELYDIKNTSEPLVIASIEENDKVQLEGVGGFMPRAPSRLQIDHPSTETSIRLFLHSMNDGKTRGRLSDAVFDFGSLVEAYGPKEIVVLDQMCPEPALPR